MLDLDRKKVKLLTGKLCMTHRDLSRLSGVSDCNLRNILLHGQRPRLDTVGKIQYNTYVNLVYCSVKGRIGCNTGIQADNRN